MTIAIQSTNPALAALESLGLQPGAGAPPGQAPDSIPPGLLTPASPSDQGIGGDVLSLSEGAAAATLGGLTGGLSSAASAADAATSAGGAIVTLLGRMQAAAQSAANPGLGADQRATLDARFRANLAQIGQAIAGASAGGLNLLDGSASGAQSPAGTSATLTGFNLSLGGPLIGLGGDATLSDATTATNIAAQLGQAIDNVGQALGQIAAQGLAIHGHLSVVSQAAAQLSPGLAGAITSGLDGDSARLQALQVQQQLMGGAASVANQAPQSILSLFRS